MNSVSAIEINQYTFAPARVVSIGSILNVFIPLVLIGAALLCLGMLFFGGVRWLTAGGSKEQVEQSQQTITWAIAGFVVIALSFFLTKLIAFITNVAIPL